MNNHLMPTVFADFHHASLLNSLIMLFEKRMGGKVYRPIGVEWAERGFWKVYDHPATQAQFLGIGAATPDGSPKLNEVTQARYNESKNEFDVFWCKDIESDRDNKAITFEGFMRTKFDFVIASIPQHIRPFRELCDLHPSKPKLIYQIGNQWNVEAHDASFINGIMASANVVHNYPVPTIKYHQEFDLSIFKFVEPTIYHSVEPKQWPLNKVSSFVNCFNADNALFAYDWAIFSEVGKRMSDWDFRAYGGQCRDGSANGSKELAAKMADSRFIWHTKNGGDGYGHVIHNAAACGRPLIVRKQYYDNKMANDLLIDGETCIAIDGLGVSEIVAKIEHFSQHYIYVNMCKAMRERFEQVVDFDREYEQIAAFLSKL